MSKLFGVLDPTSSVTLTLGILGPLASWGLSEAMALDACALWCLHVPRVHAAPRLRFGMPIYRPMLVHPLVKKYKIYCVHNMISSSMKRSPHRSFMTIAVITPLHQRSPHCSIIYTAVTTPLHQRSPHRSIIYTAVTTPLHQRSPHRFIRPSGNHTASSLRRP